MTEAEIKEIILKEMTGVWPNYVERDRASQAAKLIAAGLQKMASKPIAPAYYPARACDCGAERVSPSVKHAVWCSIYGSSGGRRR